MAAREPHQLCAATRCRRWPCRAALAGRRGHVLGGATGQQSGLRTYGSGL